MIKTHLLESAWIIRKAREHVVHDEPARHEIRELTDSVYRQVGSIDSSIERADRSLYKAYSSYR